MCRSSWGNSNGDIDCWKNCHDSWMQLQRPDFGPKKTGTRVAEVGFLVAFSSTYQSAAEVAKPATSSSNTTNQMTIPTPSVHVRYAKRKRNQSNIVDDSWDLYWGIERKRVLVQNFAERRKSSARKGRRSTDFKQRVHVFFTASPPSEVIYCNQERISALLIQLLKSLK
jgi:hypothetical protein